jgi:hypothetical protein
MSAGHAEDDGAGAVGPPAADPTLAGVPLALLVGALTGDTPPPAGAVAATVAVGRLTGATSRDAEHADMKRSAFAKKKMRIRSAG